MDLLHCEEENTKFIAQTSDLRWISLTLKKGVVGVTPLPARVPALVETLMSLALLLLSSISDFTTLVLRVVATRRE